MLLALDAVKSAGVSYADVRITRENREAIATRERQITNVSKNETYGIGIFLTISGIELAEKIKKGQFKIGKLANRPATTPAIWAAVLSA